MLPLAQSVYGVGQYRATEGLTVIVGRGQASAGKVPVLYAHGAGGSGLTALEPAVFDDLAAIAALGYPVLAGDFAGTHTWANDATRTSFGDALTWAGTNLGTRTDKAAYLGESMGGGGTLNQGWRSPATVAAMALRVPTIAIDWVHDNVPLFTAVIEAAYGGLAGYEAALPTHDPVANTALIAPLGPRTRIWYATADEVTPPQMTLDFAAAVGCQATPIVGTHGQAANSPADQLAAWLADTIARNS